MLTEIFCQTDEFCKFYVKDILLGTTNIKPGPKAVLQLNEVMTIALYFGFSGYKNFKEYYVRAVLGGEGELKNAFRELVSYNRFIELMSESMVPMMLFSQQVAQGECTGISFIDSFKLAVCHNRRIRSHRVFRGLAQRGKTSTGWFFGFKLHIVTSQNGEVLGFYLTSGNVADNDAQVLDQVTKNIFGKLFGDKEYIINAEKLQKLYERGIQLITKIRSNMKNKLMDYHDKLVLRKRGVIESVISILKQSFSIEHSRHRSIKNFVVHIASSMAAYVFRENKPSIGKILVRPLC